MKISIPESVSRKAAMVALKTKKNSPTILFGSGLALGVATVVSACVATLKVEGVLNQHEAIVADINKAREIEPVKYSERDRKEDLTKLYIKTVVKFTRLYGPAIVLGTGAVVCLTQSHRILTSRNAALTASYAAVDRAFREYRQRVTKELGEDKDREFRYGKETREVTVEDTNGVKKKKTQHFDTAKTCSMYARLFDENNVNWSPHPEYNIAFLKLQQNWCNDRLKARGHLFLNEVYEALGIEHSAPGSQVGWLWGRGDGNQFVDFGIWRDSNMDGTINFLNGWDKGILLDFNVDGVIWKDI